jgi:argonaute-like protein implicated in RNA metabolism and viral defense
MLKLHDAARSKLDKEELLPLINELQGIAEEIKKENKNDDRWMFFQDTVVWAKLHSGLLLAADAATEIRALLANAFLPDELREDMLLQYALYNKFYPGPENDGKRVVIT